MNTQNIHDCLSSDEYSKKLFRRVCSRDEFIFYLGQKKGGYGLYVFNTDYTGQSGEHWLGARYTNGSIYLFDSFGRHPKQLVPDVWKKAVKMVKVKGVSWNKRGVQGITTNTCGDYCVLFGMVSARGINITSFIKRFFYKNNTEERDHGVRHFIVSHFGIKVVDELANPTNETFGKDRVHMKLFFPLWKALQK